jgi:hypothetical protein
MKQSARLKQAYEHSRLNRGFIIPGSTCRCFHCLGSFAGDRISRWTDDGETALCPHCGVDAVVSSAADRLSEGLIRQLRATWFDAPSRKYTAGEWRAALANEQPVPSRA